MTQERSPLRDAYRRDSYFIAGLGLAAILLLNLLHRWFESIRTYP